MKNNKIYCVECSKNTQYHIKQTPVTITVKSIQIKYTEKSAICNECGAEIYHPAINDNNVNARKEAYLKAIIDINQKSSSDLKEILEEQKKFKEDFLAICEENSKLKENQPLLKEFLSQAQSRSEIVYGDRAVCLSVLEDIYEGIVGEEKLLPQKEQQKSISELINYCKQNFDVLGCSDSHINMLVGDEEYVISIKKLKDGEHWSEI